jgi:hypothetical protein
MDHQQITVEGGEQTYLDWSWWKVPAWEKQSPQWRTVTVTADGKPLSGAQVSIFTDKWRPQWIRQWVDQWARGDATAKALAEHRLVAGGAASLDLLDGMKQDPILTPLIEQVDHDCEMNPLGSLEDVASDLSDDHGTIRFQGDPGRDYVAVAMVQGKWLGWRLFAMSTGDVTVELKPTRTLSIHLPAWTPPPDAGKDSYRSISLLLLGPSGIERRSVSAAVNLPLSSNVFRRIGEEFHRYNWSPGLYSATAFGPDSVDVPIDDLPVGSALELGSSPNVVAKMPAGPVIIEPGDGPQKLLLPANN